MQIAQARMIALHHLKMKVHLTVHHLIVIAHLDQIEEKRILKEDDIN